MILQRQLEKELVAWRHNLEAKPLIVRGARQVGKSYLIESFGKQYFENRITINFELSPEYKSCFHTLKPQEICNAISIISQQKIIPGKTLLFLDEIQDCGEAIQALRYFKEQMPGLHVIGAGSLLELALKKAEYRMPVGRVSFLYLYPLSFKEFLTAFNQEVFEYLEKANINQPIPLAIHEHLLKQLKLYLLLGGMPEALSHYETEASLTSIQAIQADIIETYINDFGHYADFANPRYLQNCFNKVPLMIGQQIKYNKIDPNIRSRELKDALHTLESAAVIHRIYATSAQGLPLDSTLNEKKFKLNFIDVGLVKRFNQLDAKLLLNEDIMLLNKGALAEQFVGQELLAYSPAFEKAKLYFWAREKRDSTAEVDYIQVIEGNIYPIEVKSGTTGTLRSLKQYMDEHSCKIGIRVSLSSLSFSDNILSIPLYMISELPRLVKEIR